MNEKEDVFSLKIFPITIFAMFIVGVLAFKDLAGAIVLWPFVKLFGIKYPMFVTVKLLNNWTAWKFILGAISLALAVDLCRYVLHSYSVRKKSG